MELRKQYIDNLKYVIRHNVFVKYDNIIEGYYEWDIDYWRKIKGNEFSPEFNLCGHYWDLKLNKNYSKLSNSLSSFDIVLRSKDSVKSQINYSCAVSIREKSNYSEYIAKEMSSRSSEKYSNFDKDYYKNAFKSFLKSDNIVISVYMYIYVNSSEEKKINFMNKLTRNLRSEETNNYKLIGKDYYEWKIENWNGIKYNCEAEYSMKFNICGYNWKLKIYPNGVDESDNVSLYLKNLDVGDIKSHIFVKCALFMSNYDNYDSCHIREFSTNFNSNNNTDGINDFIPKKQLYENYCYREPLVNNNKVIVGAYLFVYEYKKVDNIVKDIKESIEKRSINKNEYAQEDYYEWNIDNWKKFKSNKKVVYSPEFEIGGHIWRLHLYPNGNSSSDNRENISLFLHSKTAKNGSLIHISADYSLYIRNYKNYSCCHTYVSDNSCNFNEDDTEYGCDQFIKITDLYIKNKINNTVLVEDNKLVIGAYIRVHRFGREQFIQEIKDEIYENNQNVDDIKNEKYFEWKIDNWNNIKNRDVILSPEFRTNDYSWKLKLYPNGCKKRFQDHISIFLHNINVMRKDFSEFSNVYGDIVFFVRNVNDYSCNYIIKKYNLEVFNKYNNYCCLREFIEKSKINNDGGNQCLLEDDKIIFGVYICQYKPEKFDNFVKRMRNLLDDSQYRGNNILDERFFEEEVCDWEKDSKIYSFSNEIYVGDYLWELTLLPDKDEKVTAIALTCNEYDDEKSEKRNTNIYVKFVLYIRNYKDFNCIKSTSSGKYYKYNKDNKLLGVNEFIEDKELYDSGRHLLEDDKLVYGCYLRIYKKEPEIKIVNKDITVEFQSKDKKNGGGILYHYDENGDCDVKLYGYKLDNNDNIEYVNYDVEKYNTDNPKLKKNNANQGKIELHNIISESDLEDSDLEEENPELAVAIGDYKADESYEIDFKLGDKIIILDWNYDDEYAKGVKYDDVQKKKLDKGFSLFPKEYIRKLDKKFVEDVENDRIRPPTKRPSKPPKATESSKSSVASPQPTMTSPLQPGVRPVYQPAYQARPGAVPIGQPPIQVLPPNLQPYSAAPPRPYVQPVPQYTLSPPQQYAQPIPQSPYARPATPGQYPPQPYGQAPPSPRPQYSYSVPPAQPIQQAAPQAAPQAYRQYSLPVQQTYTQPPPQSNLYPSLSPQPVPQSTLYPPLSPQPAPQSAPAPGTYPPQPPFGQAPPPSPQPPFGQAPPPSPQPPYAQVPLSPQPPYNIPSPQLSPYQQPYSMPQSYSMPSPQPKPFVPLEPQMPASAPSSEKL